jgi:hypothetical protein
MKLLIIPDIHHKVDIADKILSKEAGNFDKVIFLGDYQDDFGDSISIAEKTANWLKNSLKEENRVHLLGNHDASYMFPKNVNLYCPGWTKEKSKVVNSILTREDWDKLKLFHYENDFLFTHAGLHKSFNCQFLGFTLTGLQEDCDEAMERSRGMMNHPLLECGVSRGGDEPFGGIIWMDFSELEPIPNLNQIFGHTPAYNVREQHEPTSKNYCIDTGLRHYILMTDGKVEVKKVDFSL